MLKTIVLAGSLVLVLALGFAPTRALAEPAAPDLLVFAAASLKNSLDELGQRFQAAGGQRVVVSYAASSMLAKQIENGAPADLFFSADLDWMDYLAARKLIRTESRQNLLGNSLVLIAPKNQPEPLVVAPGFALAERLGDGRLALGDPAHVPIGKYAKQALENLGVWSSVAGMLAPTESVRAALALVARGEAPLGIVYATDARVEPGVTVIGRFPENSHPAVIYPAAIVATSQHPEAAALLAFLASPVAKTVFESYGFSVLSGAP